MHGGIEGLRDGEGGREGDSKREQHVNKNFNQTSEIDLDRLL